MTIKNSHFSTIRALLPIIFFSLIAITASVFLFNAPHNLLASTALWGNDLPICQEWSEIVRLMWVKDRHLWGYCPYYMGGYPFVQYTSALVWGMFFIVFSSLPMGLRSAIFMCLVSALVPVGYFLAHQRLTRSNKSAIMASAVGTFCFFLGPAVFFWWLGAVETVLSLTFALLAFSFLIAWSRDNKLFDWAGMVICGAFSLMSHKTGGLYLAISMLLAFPLLVKATPAKKWVFILYFSLAGLLMLFANLFWLIPLLKYVHYRVEVPQDLWSSLGRGGIIKDFFSIFTPAGSLPMLWFIVILGTTGLISWLKKEKYLALAYGCGVIFWTFSGYLGDEIKSLQAIQPRRFLVFVLAFLVPLAVMGITHLKETKTQRIVTPLMITFAVIAILAPNAYRYLLKFRLEPQIPSKMAEVLTAIKTHSSTPRVLIEDTAGSKLGIIPYEGAHFYTLVHHFTGMEAFVGYNHGLLHSSRGMKDGKFMGKPIEQVSLAELEEFLDVYNIGAVLCFSESAKKLLDNATSLVTKVGDYGSRRQLALYRVNNPKGFIIGGRGNVRAEVNHIYVQNLVAEGDSVIIKYHWDEALRCAPNCTVERVFLAGDKVGFIKVHNPPSSFTIYFEH